MKRAILLLALISAPAGAQTWSDSGLETANYKYVAVMVVDLSTDAGSIGLTKDRIQSRVELRLRSAGLTPGDDASKDETMLIVNVHVVGRAFHILVEYYRQVIFMRGNQQYRDFATTWQAISTGTHGNDVAYIIDGLDGQLDRFLNEYLNVNQK